MTGKTQVAELSFAEPEMIKLKYMSDHNLND